ncbi:MAG: glycosyltransferase, partial [Spirochaetota bacterium]
MTNSWGPLLLAVLGALDLVVLLAIVVTRRRSSRRQARRVWVREFMQIAFPTAPVSAVVDALHRDPDAFFHEYMDLADSIELPAEQEEKLQRALVQARRFPLLIRDLRSRWPSRRRRAAIWLSFALPEHAVRPLIAGLERERSRSVRLHMAHALVRLGEPAVIPTIVDTLCDSDAEYQRQIYGLLAQFGSELHAYFEVLRRRREPEIRRMLAHVAAERGDDTGRQYLIDLTRSEVRALAIDATHALIRGYVHTLDIETMLASSDRMVANLTIEALGMLGPQRSLRPLLEATNAPETRKSAIVGLSRLVRERPQTYGLLIDELLGPDSHADPNALMEVISNRVEYLIERVIREPDSPQRILLDRLVRSNRASGVLGFLNRNRDAATERVLTEAVATAIHETPSARALFSGHAKPSVLGRLGLTRIEFRQERGARVDESVRPLFIFAILLATVALPFGAYLGVRAIVSSGIAGPGWLIDYIRTFTLAFGVYAFALNFIYLLLLLFASWSVSSQQQTLQIKPLSMLLSAGMLPSISIIAPAYNEEATIVESVNSLLNIRYPDFEIIVVNDGSPDGTLNELIASFELERTDIFLHGYLHTQPVRAVYRNPRIPELTVIDKQNGGKADSLNSGINAS